MQIKLLSSRCQDSLETPIEGSEFIFDSVPLMYCKCQRVNFRLNGSNIDSPDWIKKEKSNK